MFSRFCPEDGILPYAILLSISLCHVISYSGRGQFRFWRKDQADYSSYSVFSPSRINPMMTAAAGAGGGVKNIIPSNEHSGGRNQFGKRRAVRAWLDGQDGRWAEDGVTGAGLSLVC